MRLAELRFDAGLSPETLGEKCGVAGTTIRAIEGGKRPSPQTAKKIADYFEVKPSDLWPLEAAA